MARQFKYNGKTYESMMSIARELGIRRLYPRDFEKYGIVEIVAVGEPQDIPNTPECSEDSTQFHDPTTRYELVNEYGTGFNKRAFVTHIQKPNMNIKYLVSYGGVVAKIENGEAQVYGTYSSETLTHIKVFLQQNGFKADSCIQIRKDYM